jgi:hypothetical protein
MKDGNQPKNANDKRKPQQQEGEEFGNIKSKQVTEDTIRRRSDTARGSEPETRGASGPRS